MSKYDFAIIIGVAAAIFLAIAFRLRFTPKKVKVPFLEFEISSFESLTVVKLFRSVTRPVLISANVNENSKSPLVLMHLGWMMVCEAFIDRFSEYPTDENLMKTIKYIGPQNAEFVKCFRQMYELSIREGNKLNRNLALEYVGRGPALAQRVSGNSTPLYELADHLYRKWDLRT